MKKKILDFSKRPLVILEMANNHMGDITHAQKIISKYSNLTKKFRKNIDFAIKFQFRDLNSYIHNSYKDGENKYVKRFLETKLSNSEWNKLLDYAKKNFFTICTPFDEKSVDRIVRLNFNFMKIASCSMDEWPLLEHIASKTKKIKLIASLGGGDDQSIRNIISFFSSKNNNIKYLYCVAKYPTDPSNLNLSYFSYLKKIYGDKIMGFSTHENPDEEISVSMAYAMGARIFEKHVALETKKYKKNLYSVNVIQFEKWLKSLNNSILRFGSVNGRNKFLEEEKQNLLIFKRGVYLKDKTLKNKNDKLKKNDFFLAYPAVKGQLLSNDISKFKTYYFKSKMSISGPILKKNLILKNDRKNIEEIRNKISQLIDISKVIVRNDSKLEISHHTGIKNFYKIGLTMITIHNSKYCKKLLFLLNKQSHPEQYHKKKQETFFLLFGKVRLELIDKKKKFVKILKAGDIFTIKPGVIHKFSSISTQGSVIEELSTSSFKNDSYYLDKKITKNKNRKTFISLN
ncbi:N-acetylneuraminate synthase family protein [Pelagibacterales bacterium SAG-MED50]|nr:N-acetylneuraminate synthase family protein [Pelagibacterales bacterium SAG-MED50]